jgi:chemotaxis protein methyltransferase CheR
MTTTLPFSISIPPTATQRTDIPSALINELASVIERRALMQFGTERRSHLINIVTARARELKEHDVAAYIRRAMLPGSEPELMMLIDDLTINETTFFRNAPQLELFARIILPEIIARKKATAGDRRINIWSAACSTGQEVYTLAMLAFDGMRFLPQWEANVLGTDISPTVVEIAKRATYPKARLDTVPPEFLTRYFDDLGDKIKVKDMLRRMVHFQVHNLNDPAPMGVFDVIFCRNVMIYFSREEQANLAKKFKSRLASGGCLFIGHSESLQGLDVGLKCRVQEGGVVYQKEGA